MERIHSGQKQDRLLFQDLRSQTHTILSEKYYIATFHIPHIGSTNFRSNVTIIGDICESKTVANMLKYSVFSLARKPDKREICLTLTKLIFFKNIDQRVKIILIFVAVIDFHRSRIVKDLLS